MSYPPAALGRFTWRKHHGPETTGTITWDGKGKAIGRKQPTLGPVHDHDLFISMAVVLWRDPRDKFWPSDSSGGACYNPLISTGAAGGAAASPTFQMPGVAAGLWSLPLACPFCTENILRQPQGDSAVDDGAKVGPSF